MSAPWGPVVLTDTGPFHGSVGELSYCISSQLDEWRLSYTYADAGCDDPERVWSRFVTVSDDSLELRPALPDRAVVVRPQSPIILLPGRWGRFHVRIPVWVRFVSHADGGSVTAAEAPSRELSSTWFGDMETGELCYAVQSRLLRASNEDPDPAFAYAEILVQNSSPELLKFERICIHTERMALFQSPDALWANEVRVTYRGADQISQLTFAKGPPSHVHSVREAGGPRLMSDAHLLSRTFSIIREITGI